MGGSLQIKSAYPYIRTFAMEMVRGQLSHSSSVVVSQQ